MRFQGALPLGFFAIKLLIHFLLIGRYGYHGDELYFIECGKHLAFGYVDQGPWVPWIARLSGELFGYSLVGLRLLPAIAGAASVALTVLIAREWGGRRTAQAIAGLAMLIAPAYLQMASFLHIPVFEALFWTLNAYLIVLLMKRNQPELWLMVGFVAGIGLLNKHTMLLWGLGIGVGLILSEHRRQLRCAWLWAGVGIAFVLFLPNLIWQYHHEWATLQFVRNMRAGVLADIPRALFLLGQLLYMHPFSTPIWVAGLIYFFSPIGKCHRVFGWLFVVVLAVLLISGAKPYYLAPAFPTLFAGGAIVLERVLEQCNSRRPVPAVMTALIIGGGLTAPLALPILPLEMSDKIIQQVFGFVIDDPAMLDGDFHQEYGWREQAAVVGKVYQSLSEQQRSKVIVLTKKYNQASAINFFGAAWGLPEAFSGHMNYYLWGPPKCCSEIIVAYGLRLATLKSLCGEVTAAAEIFHPLALKQDNRLLVYICRFPKRSIQGLWHEFKHFDHVDRDADANSSLMEPTARR